MKYDMYILYYIYYIYIHTFLGIIFIIFGMVTPMVLMAYGDGTIGDSMASHPSRSKQQRRQIQFQGMTCCEVGQGLEMDLDGKIYGKIMEHAIFMGRFFWGNHGKSHINGGYKWIHHPAMWKPRCGR
jgi:hypothetical protein